MFFRGLLGLLTGGLFGCVFGLILYLVFWIVMNAFSDYNAPEKLANQFAAVSCVFLSVIGFFTGLMSD